MSRSRRKTPICGMTTARSEKQDKKRWHKTFRTKVRQALKQGADVLPHHREISDPWLMDKDGKQTVDPAKFPKIMRK